MMAEQIRGIRVPSRTFVVLEGFSPGAALSTGTGGLWRREAKEARIASGGVCGV
jgi:hypothetical protein